MTTMNRARALLLAGSLLVGVLATVGTAWAGYITCTVGVGCMGTSGPDQLQGTAKGDTVFGKNGNDTLLGGRGGDWLIGDALSDFGADGNDLIYGGPGNDELIDGGGSDLLKGSGGNDLIYANSDKLASDQDTVLAGKGDDTIHANDGYQDDINCGSGKDEVTFDQNIDKVAANCEKQHPV
jgi:Ca2+-binding RTX toxin-like protein